MKKLVFKALFLFLVLTVNAQTKEITIKVKLQDFVGEWKGEGWHKHPDHTNYFVQTCKITPKLGGKILLIEQKAHIKEQPEKVIFEELAIWRYEEKDDRILVTSYKGSRMLESELQFSGNKIIARRNEQVQFITEIDGTGRYVMRGTNQGEVFFEMTLIKEN